VWGAAKSRGAPPRIRLRMRRAALLVPLVCLVASCSDENERTYGFDDAARCFRGAGFEVISGEETIPPTPDARDFAVWDGNRMVYTLVFFKTVGLAKERAPLPPLPAIPGSGEVERARDGNVIVFTIRGGHMPPAKQQDGRALDQCLPEE
jgi:hypothetical protein